MLFLKIRLTSRIISMLVISSKDFVNKDNKFMNYYFEYNKKKSTFFVIFKSTFDHNPFILAKDIAIRDTYLTNNYLKFNLKNVIHYIILKIPFNINPTPIIFIQVIFPYMGMIYGLYKISPNTIVLSIISIVY